MQIKKLLRAFGYDIRHYHSFYDTVLRHYSIETILDIGANDGLWAAEMRVLYPRAHIFAFEPLEDCFQRASDRFIGDNRFHAFNVALGDTDGEHDIERSSFHPSSSMRPMAGLHKELYPKSSVSTKERVHMRTLDSIADLDFRDDTLVKMDVQGFEDKVILGGSKTLAKARVIVAETAFVRLYDGQPLFGTIHDLLRSIGFSYHGNCGEHFSPKTGERIYEDSVFIRD